MHDDPPRQAQTGRMGALCWCVVVRRTSPLVRPSPSLSSMQREVFHAWPRRAEKSEPNLFRGIEPPAQVLWPSPGQRPLTGGREGSVMLKASSRREQEA